MFAWVPNDPAGSSTLVARLAPSALLVFPLVETVNFGVKLNALQCVTWNGTPIVSILFSLEWIVPVTSILLQLVGLNWKFERVVIALMCWISSGIPSSDVGIVSGVPGGFDVIVTAAVSGLISIFPRTSTQSHGGWLWAVFAKSNGPAFAGTVNVIPHGAP